MTPIFGFGQGSHTLVNSLGQIGHRVSDAAALVADPSASTPEQTLATLVDLSKLTAQARAAATFLETMDELSAALLRGPRK